MTQRLYRATRLVIKPSRVRPLEARPASQVNFPSDQAEVPSGAYSDLIDPANAQLVIDPANGQPFTVWVDS